MSDRPFAVRTHAETRARWRDEPTRRPPLHPVVAAIVGEGEMVPHFIPYLSEIRDERGLRVQFSVAVMQPKDLRTPWILCDVFDLSVIEPNGRKRALSIDFIVERANTRGSLVRAYGKAHRLELGYLPYVPGARLDRASIDCAKIGGIVPLVTS
jgi:hypothetical protein